MDKEELIEVLREFDNKRIEQLDKKARDLFYAIMNIADERDELRKKEINLTKELARYIIKENDAINTGIFISLLSFYYQEKYDVTIEDFIKSLKNSIKKLENE